MFYVPLITLTTVRVLSFPEPVTLKVTRERTSMRTCLITSALPLEVPPSKKGPHRLVAKESDVINSRELVAETEVVTTVVSRSL